MVTYELHRIPDAEWLEFETICDNCGDDLLPGEFAHWTPGDERSYCSRQCWYRGEEYRSIKSGF